MQNLKGPRNSEKEYKRRIEDLEFLGRLRRAGIDELHSTKRDYMSSSAPVWKRIAIDRAILKWIIKNEF